MNHASWEEKSCVNSSAAPGAEGASNDADAHAADAAVAAGGGSAASASERNVAEDRLASGSACTNEAREGLPAEAGGGAAGSEGNTKGAAETGVNAGAARDADRTYDTGTNPWRSGRPSICTFIQPSCSWPSAEKWGAGS